MASRKQATTVCYDGEAVARLIPCQMYIYGYLLEQRPKWLSAKEIGIALGSMEVHPRMSDISRKHPGLIERQPGPDPQPGQSRQKLYRASSRVTVRTNEGEA